MSKLSKTFRSSTKRQRGNMSKLQNKISHLLAHTNSSQDPRTCMKHLLDEEN
ncbi:MAG: hypothetical protein ACETVM_00875 [Candidatus Bathyarchaeia archaeon]